MAAGLNREKYQWDINIDPQAKNKQNLYEMFTGEQWAEVSAAIEQESMADTYKDTGKFTGQVKPSEFGVEKAEYDFNNTRAAHTLLRGRKNSKMSLEGSAARFPGKSLFFPKEIGDKNDIGANAPKIVVNPRHLIPEAIPTKSKSVDKEGEKEPVVVFETPKDNLGKGEQLKLELDEIKETIEEATETEVEVEYTEQAEELEEANGVAIQILKEDFSEEYLDLLWDEFTAVLGHDNIDVRLDVLEDGTKVLRIEGEGVTDMSAQKLFEALEFGGGLHKGDYDIYAEKVTKAGEDVVKKTPTEFEELEAAAEAEAEVEEMELVEPEPEVEQEKRFTWEDVEKGEERELSTKEQAKVEEMDEEVSMLQSDVEHYENEIVNLDEEISIEQGNLVETKQRYNDELKKLRAQPASGKDGKEAKREAIEQLKVEKQEAAEEIQEIITSYKDDRKVAQKEINKAKKRIDKLEAKKKEMITPEPTEPIMYKEGQPLEPLQSLFREIITGHKVGKSRFKSKHATIVLDGNQAVNAHKDLNLKRLEVAPGKSVQESFIEEVKKLDIRGLTVRFDEKINTYIIAINPMYGQWSLGIVGLEVVKSNGKTGVRDVEGVAYQYLQHLAKIATHYGPKWAMDPNHPASKAFGNGMVSLKIHEEFQGRDGRYKSRSVLFKSWGKTSIEQLRENYRSFTDYEVYNEKGEFNTRYPDKGEIKVVENNDDLAELGLSHFVVTLKQQEFSEDAWRGFVGMLQKYNSDLNLEFRFTNDSPDGPRTLTIVKKGNTAEFEMTASDVRQFIESYTMKFVSPFGSETEAVNKPIYEGNFVQIEEYNPAKKYVVPEPLPLPHINRIKPESILRLIRNHPIIKDLVSYSPSGGTGFKIREEFHSYLSKEQLEQGKFIIDRNRNESNADYKKKLYRTLERLNEIQKAEYEKSFPIAPKGGNASNGTKPKTEAERKSQRQERVNKIKKDNSKEDGLQLSFWNRKRKEQGVEKLPTIAEEAKGRVRDANMAVGKVLKENKGKLLHDKEYRKSVYEYHRNKLGRQLKVHDYPWYRYLKKHGFAEEYDFMRLRFGNTAKTELEFRQVYEKLFKDITKDDYPIYQDMVMYRRFEAIYENWHEQIESMGFEIERNNTIIAEANEVYDQEAAYQNAVELRKNKQEYDMDVLVEGGFFNKQLRAAVRERLKRHGRARAKAERHNESLNKRGIEVSRKATQYRDIITSKSPEVIHRELPEDFNFLADYKMMVEHVKNRKQYITDSREQFSTEATSSKEHLDFLTERVDGYFAEGQKLLRRLWEAEIITDDAYNAMKGIDYTRLDYDGRIVEEFNALHDANDLAAREQMDLHKLGMGSLDSPIVNPEFHLNLFMDRVNKAIAFNEARKLGGRTLIKSLEGMEANESVIIDRGQERPHGFFKFTWMSSGEKAFTGSDKDIEELKEVYRFSDSDIESIMEAFNEERFTQMKAKLSQTNFDMVDFGQGAESFGIGQKGVFIRQELYDSFSTSDDAKKIMIITATNNMLKTLATGRNARFALVNILRDVRFLAQTTDRFDLNGPIGSVVSKVLPTTAFINGLIKSAREIPRYYDYKQNGEQTEIENLINLGMGFDGLIRTQPNTKGNPYGTLESAIDKQIKKPSRAKSILNKYQHFLEGFEYGTRIAIAKEAKKRLTADYLKQHGAEPTGEQLHIIEKKAVVEGRNVIDFAKHGEIIKKIDQFIPYFNAASQGLWSTYDKIKADPKNFIIKSAGYVMEAFMLSLWNNGTMLKQYAEGLDDDDPMKDYYLNQAEEMYYYYSSIDPMEKMSNALIVTPFRINEETNRHGEKVGTPLTMRISTPQTLRYLNFLAENASRAARGESVESETALREFTTVLEGAVFIPDATTSPIVAATLRGGFGYDPYYKRMLYDNSIAPESRYDPSKHYKIFGRMANNELGIGPEQWEGIFRSFIPTSNVGVKASMDILDTVISKMTGEEVVQGNALRQYTGLFQPTTNWTTALNIESKDRVYKSEDAEVKIIVNNLIRANARKNGGPQQTNIRELIPELRQALADEKVTDPMRQVDAIKLMVRMELRRKDPAADAIAYATTTEGKAEAFLEYKRRFGDERAKEVLELLLMIDAIGAREMMWVEMMIRDDAKTVQEVRDK